MNAFFRKYWFFTGLALVFYLGLNHPVSGSALREYYISKGMILLLFVLSGLTLDTKGALKQILNFKVFLAALASSLIITPLVAFYLGKAVFSNPDFVVGALIIGAAPVTLASGTVLTALAGGNVALSLFICLASNLASLLSIPFVLSLLLSVQGGTELPVWDIFTGLVSGVLLPTLAGQLLRIWLKKYLVAWKSVISIYSQLVVLVIVLNAVAGSADKIFAAGSAMAWVFICMAGLHLGYLAMNRGICRLLRLDRPSTSAFTIHTSQKTLTISYVVWSGFFALNYPLAMVPGIAYHLGQMIIDTMLARRLAARSIAG